MRHIFILTVEKDRECLQKKKTQDYQSLFQLYYYEWFWFSVVTLSFYEPRNQYTKVVRHLPQHRSSLWFETCYDPSTFLLPDLTISGLLYMER